MKIGDKILIKATNKIAIIRDFPESKPSKKFLYADIGKNGAVYFYDEFYLLVEPTKSSNPSHSDFMNFLDDNPQNEVQEPKELTKREKELIWLADFEAEQRYNDQNNSFHL